MRHFIVFLAVLFGFLVVLLGAAALVVKGAEKLGKRASKWNGDGKE